LSWNFRQIRPTVDFDRPLCSAIDLRDQWVAFFGISSSVVTTTASTWSTLMVGGRPGRGPSTRPSSRCARNRRRHLRTVSAATRNSRATTTTGGTSGPAHASTIRARRASAWADDARRVHRSSTARSSSDSSNGSSFGPRRGTDAPPAEVTQLPTINYWRRTLTSRLRTDSGRGRDAYNLISYR